MKDRLFIRQVFKGNENAYGTYVPSGEVDARGKAKGSCKTLPLPEGEVFKVSVSFQLTNNTNVFGVALTLILTKDLITDNFLSA